MHRIPLWHRACAVPSWLRVRGVECACPSALGVQRGWVRRGRGSVERGSRFEWGFRERPKGPGERPVAAPASRVNRRTRIVLATFNRDKVRELRKLLADLPVDVVGLYEIAGANAAPEAGHTVRENALEKARAAYDLTGMT